MELACGKWPGSSSLLLGPWPDIENIVKTTEALVVMESLE